LFESSDGESMSTTTTAKRGRLATIIGVLCLMISGGKQPSAQTGYYTLVDIVDPHLLGAPALDINDNGVVVGSGVGPGSGFLWTQASGSQAIPLFTDQGHASRLRINNSGVVAGIGCGGN